MEALLKMFQLRPTTTAVNKKMFAYFILWRARCILIIINLVKTIWKINASLIQKRFRAHWTTCILTYRATTDVFIMVTVISNKTSTLMRDVSWWWDMQDRKSSKGKPQVWGRMSSEGEGEILVNRPKQPIMMDYLAHDNNTCVFKSVLSSFILLL